MTKDYLIRRYAPGDELIAGLAVACRVLVRPAARARERVPPDVVEARVRRLLVLGADRGRLRPHPVPAVASRLRRPAPAEGVSLPRRRRRGHGAVRVRRRQRARRRTAADFYPWYPGSPAYPPDREFDATVDAADIKTFTASSRDAHPLQHERLPPRRLRDGEAARARDRHVLLAGVAQVAHGAELPAGRRRGTHAVRPAALRRQLTKAVDSLDAIARHRLVEEGSVRPLALATCVPEVEQRALRPRPPAAEAEPAQANSEVDVLLAPPFEAVVEAVGPLVVRPPDAEQRAIAVPVRDEIRQSLPSGATPVARRQRRERLCVAALAQPPARPASGESAGARRARAWSARGRARAASRRRTSPAWRLRAAPRRSRDAAPRRRRRGRGSPRSPRARRGS